MQSPAVPVRNPALKAPEVGHEIEQGEAYRQGAKGQEHEPRAVPGGFFFQNTLLVRFVDDNVDEWLAHGLYFSHKSLNGVKQHRLNRLYFYDLTPQLPALRVSSRTVTERALNPPEAALWYADAAEPINFAGFVQFDGELNEIALKEALAKVQARHPFLRLRIRSDSNRGQPHFEPCAEEIPVQCLETNIEALNEVLVRELSTRIVAARGPLVRCVWLRHSDTSHHLIVVFHHSIGDAKSSVFFLRDVLLALNGQLKPGPSTPVLSLWERMPRAAKPFRSFLVFALAMGRELRRALRFGRPRLLKADSPSNLGERSPMLARHVFSEHETARLVELARENETTVHAVVSACLLQAAAYDVARGPACVGFATPVDLRAQLSPSVNDEIGYFVGGVASSHGVDPAEAPWDLARKVRADVVQDTQRSTAVIFHRVSAWFLALFAMRGYEPKRIAAAVYSLRTQAAGLTNLGRLEVASEYGPRRVRAWSFVVSPSALGDFVTSATTFEGQLAWNFTGMSPTFSAAHFEAIHQDAARRLRTLLGL